MSDILPCPFCNELPVYSSRASDFTMTTEVHFLACYCGGNSACAHKMGATREEVILKWNTRGGVEP